MQSTLVALDNGLNLSCFDQGEHSEFAVVMLPGPTDSWLSYRAVLERMPSALRAIAVSQRGHGDSTNFALRGFVDSVVAPLDDPIDLDFARSWVLDTSAKNLDATAANELVAEVLKVPARVWREMFAGLVSYDDTPATHRIAAPTILIWGDADGLVGRDMQDGLLRSLPDARLIVYPGAGHTPRWEHSDRFSSDLAAFAKALSRL